MSMKQFAVEELLTASDVNVYCVNSIGARKTSGTSVVSSTTLVDDNHLSVTVAGNSAYELSGLLKYTSGSATPGLKVQWVGPSGASLSWSAIALVMGATSQQDIATIPSAISSTVSMGTLAGATEYVHFRGMLATAASSGTFKLQFAQDTSSASQTTLLQDSFFVLRRFD